MSSRRAPLVVCSIGSTDPTARAGVGRDLAAFERLGVRGVFAVAGVTAQNARGVKSVSAITPALLRAQLRAIWEECRPAALRIGLLPNAAAITTLAAFLRSLGRRPPAVLDPVMRSSSGARFLGPTELRALRELLPLVTLVTPNADEAETLAGFRVRTIDDASRAALELRKRGCAVLVKGGHIAGARVVDVLADDRGLMRFGAARLDASMRGTGCTLAAAIAVWLARGVTLRQAVARGRAFVRRELEAQPRPRARGRA